jgi:hypothetical protein
MTMAERDDNDATLKRFREASDRTVPKTIINPRHSGELGPEPDLQWETQREDGGPYLPTVIHENTAGNEPHTPYFARKFYPRGWRD